MAITIIKSIIIMIILNIITISIMIINGIAENAAIT